MRLRWLRHPSGNDLRCQQAISLLAAYLDNALDADMRDRLEAHLADCPDCAEHLKQIEVSILIVGEIRAEDLDPAARADLMDLYRRWRADTPTD